ncbi:transmembrane protein, putative (macronuclear) [Tetrahymena thermophila SB210]|uniref:Transmembrane protein, putative n=1 Tax=Tetrahymena thermophila (strain SB210) TaxID=312017 RepID=I7M1Z4_TETTS|nr:transmembrane protein, putative [Tetrahymena thermophila SB210]EAR98174.2 transmembrane protein, putative [Tetrahymena thermophila SB210]|eukprot:XP_001018419.2 transmembrane protein, putative [Tetrahymena thermophila SB210]
MQTQINQIYLQNQMIIKTKQSNPIQFGSNLLSNSQHSLSFSSPFFSIIKLIKIYTNKQTKQNKTKQIITKNYKRMAGFSINESSYKEKDNKEEDVADSLSDRLTYHSQSVEDSIDNEHHQTQIDQYHLLKKKKKYLLINNIVAIFNLVVQGFLLAMYIFLMKISFHRELFIFFIISAIAVTLVELISIFMLSSHNKTKRIYISIFTSIAFDILQAICNIICLISIQKSSFCGLFFWSKNECFKSENLYDFIENYCELQNDTYEISNTIYNNLSSCLINQKTSKHQFENQMTIINNQAYLLILYASIIYKMTVNIILKSLVLFKCFQINKKMIATQKQLHQIIKNHYHISKNKFAN